MYPYYLLRASQSTKCGTTAKYAKGIRRMNEILSDEIALSKK